MKQSSLFLLLVFLLSFSGKAEELRNAEAAQRIPGAAHLWLKPHLQLPAFVRFAPHREFTRVQLEGFIQENMNWRAGIDELVFQKEELDQLGQRHERFQQHYQGYPVEGSMFIVHSRNGRVFAMNGDFFQLNDLSLQVSLNEQQALQKALEAVDANTYKWELPREERRLQHLLQGNATETGPYTYRPEGELVIAPVEGDVKNGTFRLAWKFDVYAQVPLSREDIFVDAQNGAIIWKLDKLHSVDRVGTAVTGYSGTQTITADSIMGGFRLREAGRGNGIFTWNMNNGTSRANRVDFTDADNFWNNVNASLDQYATDAHWGAEATYDYFLQEHGRNSIDGNGFALNQYVHYGAFSTGNAFWDGAAMYYYDGNGNPFTALDVTGHEIAHGLTTNSANLIYQNEPGALNESFSDIFGKAIEKWARPNNFSWRVGADLGFAIRSMSNPNSQGDPRNYQGTSWYTGTGDNGGVHINSGVQNHWFYLLAEGGSGTNDFGNPYNVPQIGFDTAAAVAFRNLTVYLTRFSAYEDARFYAIESAIDLYGACGSIHSAVANAWYAVGVGNAFSTVPVSDFVAPNPQTCTAPYVIRFQDQSAGAGSYLWDFGDGDSSSLANPSHTYASPGTYNVTLSITGICGGADTTVKSSYVTVTQAPPVPTATSQAVACKSQAVLTASSTGDTYWYDANDNLLHVGDTFQTPTLVTNQVFYARNEILPPSVKGGPANNSIGTGAFFQFDNRYLVFDVHQDAILESVLVYASGGGNRTIEYRDATGAVLASQTVNIPNGQSRVQLDFQLIPGNNHQLAISGTADLYRNNSGSSYPYNIGNLLTIKQSNASRPTDFYYFFYDWEVTGSGCKSDKLPVTASILPLSSPSVNPAERCGPGTVTLAVNNPGTHQVNWYDSNNALLATGPSFTSPSLAATTDFYVELESAEALQRVGPSTGQAVGGGNYHDTQFDARLQFEVLTPMILKSVWVDANTQGSRDIVLEDGSGNMLQTLSIFIPAGQQRIPLNLSLQPGKYAIGGREMDLFRNNTGAQFPYQLANLVSITGTNAGTSNDFYYYFYDWEVQEIPCYSDKVLVQAVVSQKPTAAFSYTAVGRTLSFQDQSSTAQSWQWDFGDGNSSTQQNPTHTYAFPGTYSVKLSVNNGSCSSDTTLTFEVLPGTAVEDLLEPNGFQLYPNPGTGQFTLQARARSAQFMSFQVYDLTGRELFSTSARQTRFLREQVDLQYAAKGTYLVRLTLGDGSVMKKYILMR